MNTKKATFIFKLSRAIEILIVFICFILEIVEYSAFKTFYSAQGFQDSAYFNGGIAQSTSKGLYYYNGVKIFYYIVLVLTLIDGGFYITRFCSAYQKGPFKRDIAVNAFFTMIWFLSSIINIYPSFKGYGYICNYMDMDMVRECNAKVMTISLGWINSFLFLVTTFVALKMWKERKERYEGERRVEALGEVVYKYKPRPNTIVQVDEPEQVMIYKTIKTDKKKVTPTYVIKTSQV